MICITSRFKPSSLRGARNTNYEPVFFFTARVVEWRPPVRDRHAIVPCFTAGFVCGSSTEVAPCSPFPNSTQIFISCFAHGAVLCRVRTDPPFFLPRLCKPHTQYTSCDNRCAWLFDFGAWSLRIPKAIILSRIYTHNRTMKKK